MGLDQYLYAKCFTSPSEWLGKERNKLYASVLEATNATNFITKDAPSISVEVKVGYWRKSNQVHQWFVDNCQDGEDDCRESYVPREKLIELRDICQEILADHSLADDLLPTQSGFFFGSTEYDEWYFRDLEETVLIINNALVSVPDNYEFYYQSSW